MASAISSVPFTNSAILPTQSLSTFLNNTLHNYHFLHTVNSHCHSNHQLCFSRSSCCAELYFHDLVAYPFVNCETEFSSSLDYSSSSRFSLLWWHTAGQVWWFRRYNSSDWREDEGSWKPHTLVSPAQVCVGIYLHWIKSIFFTEHDNYGQS